MTDFDNNKEKHSVCTGEIRREGFVSGLEWDSRGRRPRPRELSVPGTLRQSAIKKLASAYGPKTFGSESTVVSGLGGMVPPERGTASPGVAAVAVAGGVALWNVDPAVGGVAMPSNSPACPAPGVPVGSAHLLKTKTWKVLSVWKHYIIFFKIC